MPTSCAPRSTAASRMGPRASSRTISEVPYIDSTGIGVLVGVAHRAGEKGARFEVARPQRNVARVLGLLGVGADLNIREA